LAIRLSRVLSRGTLASCAAGLAVLLLAGASGCASFDKAFGQREEVVQFKEQTPNATRLAIRQACSHIPMATPEPLPRHASLAGMPYDIRYRVDNASDADLARLQQCLQKFPSVVGLNPEDAGGS
jgi:hypothetical protein